MGKKEYIMNASIPEQVELSVANSLSELGVEYLDSIVLEGWHRIEHDQLMDAWRAMERALQAGLVRELGVSNVNSLEQLFALYTDAEVKPAFVQYRFSVDSRLVDRMRLQVWCVKAGI